MNGLEMKLGVGLEKRWKSSMKTKWWNYLIGISELSWQFIHVDNINLELASSFQEILFLHVPTLLTANIIKTNLFPIFISILASMGNSPTTSMLKIQQVPSSTDQRRSGSTERFMTTHYSSSRRKWMRLVFFHSAGVYPSWTKKHAFQFLGTRSQNMKSRARNLLESSSTVSKEMAIFSISIQKQDIWFTEYPRRPDKAGPQSS